MSLTAAITASIVELVNVTTSFVVDNVGAVLAEGEIDDASRETLQLIVRRLNAVDAMVTARVVRDTA